MKLTPENLDYMDCRPLGRKTRITVPPELQQLAATSRAKTLAARNTAPETPPAPPAPPAKV